VKAQVEKAIHVQLTIVASEPIAELMQKLRDHVVPPELSRFFFNSACCGGVGGLRLPRVRHTQPHHNLIPTGSHAPTQPPSSRRLDRPHPPPAHPPVHPCTTTAL
jgi:hypothetical protein